MDTFRNRIILRFSEAKNYAAGDPGTVVAFVGNFAAWLAKQHGSDHIEIVDQDGERLGTWTAPAPVSEECSRCTAIVTRAAE